MSEPVIFRIERTSQGVHEAPPCPGAVRSSYTKHVYCTLPLGEAMKSPRTGWFRRLVNQRPAPGGSVADRLDVPCWTMAFEDLAALMAFIEENGPVVIQSQSDGQVMEIYDGYRE